MASSLLAVVSTGLIVSYIILIASLCTYFREQMRQEIVRLTALFATFIFAYVLRFLYQIGIGDQFYVEVVNQMFYRWIIIIFLPFIWDIISILSIYILHYKSFK